MNINKIEALIPIGAANAIHLSELANRLGVTQRTAVRMVRDARRQGFQILSGNNGYWFPSDECEKLAFVQLMRKQALSRLKTVSPISKTISEVQGQISLFESHKNIQEELLSEGVEGYE